MKVEIINKDHKDLDKIHQLYEESFPNDEKAPFSLLIEKLTTKKGLLLAYYIDNEFIGFTYLIKDKGIVYIFYFSIVKKYRNKGYGTKILSLLKDKYHDCFIFLEIEKVIDELTQKRKDFYIRNGFKDSMYRYFFYVDYEVLYYGENFDIHQCHDLFYEFTDGFLDVDFKRSSL